MSYCHVRRSSAPNRAGRNGYRTRGVPLTDVRIGGMSLPAGDASSRVGREDGGGAVCVISISLPSGILSAINSKEGRLRRWSIISSGRQDGRRRVKPPRTFFHAPRPFVARRTRPAGVYRGTFVTPWCHCRRLVNTHNRRPRNPPDVPPRSEENPLLVGRGWGVGDTGNARCPPRKIVPKGWRRPRIIRQNGPWSKTGVPFFFYSTIPRTTARGE